MELSYLLAPATILLLCLLEINSTDGSPKTFNKNSGYFTQIKYVSFNDPEDTLDEYEDALARIYKITEIRIDLNTVVT